VRSGRYVNDSERVLRMDERGGEVVSAADRLRKGYERNPGGTDDHGCSAEGGVLNATSSMRTYHSSVHDAGVP